MSVNILIKRSDVASKRPDPTALLDGELALNYDAATGGLYYADTNGDVVKIGPCQVSATAPNSSPTGSPGNSLGELWFNTAANGLFIWDGSVWVDVTTGIAVQTISSTSPITVDNTDPTNPVIGINAASTTQPGAVQLNDTVTSTSTSQAATANAVKTAYDAAVNAVQTVSGTLPVVVDNTDPQNLNVSVYTATTSAPGIVQLNDTTSSTSTSEALTANQGYLLQQEINALTVTNNLTLAGTYNASTGLVDGVTPEGTLVGFTVGSALPAPNPANVGYFVIVDVQGSTGPAGTPPYHVGDWFLSDGTAYQFLNVGFQAAYATTSDPGVVQLATDAEVQAGTDTTRAVVPSSLQSKLSDSTSTTSSTTIASSTAVKSAYDLADAAMPKSGGNFTGGVTFDNGTNLTLDPGSNLLMDGSASFSGSTNFEGASTTNFLTGSAVTFESSLTIGTTGVSYTLPSADGAANYILATDGAGVVSWVAGSEGDVTGVTGTAPITVDNTDPQNPIIGINAASTTVSGAVQLNDTVTSTSTSQAATANAVKIAYDTAVAAASAGSVNGITSDTVIFVNSTDGSDVTGQRGTTKAFRTITAALAAAQESDTIFLSPGSFTENVTLSKGVNMVGTMNDQVLAAGTRIVGNFSVGITGAGTRNWAISHVYFISTNSTAPFTVTNNSFGAGGISTVNNCTFTQQLSADPTQYAVVTTGTWTRSLYFRECTFDGNFHHNAGTASGASGYVVIDRLLGVGNSGFYNRVTTGTVEFRNPSNTLASVFQAGGVALINGAASGITPSGAGLNSVFGSAGFSYKGSAAAAGAGTVYFSGECQGTGKVDIGANLIYGYTGLIMDPANLTVNVAAIAYTTAVPSAANAQTLSQQRPRLDLLKSTSSVSAANQLATVVDASTGAIFTVANYDAGTY